MNDEIATNLAGERLATGHMPVPAPNAQQEPVRAGVASTCTTCSVVSVRGARDGTGSFTEGAPHTELPTERRSPRQAVPRRTASLRLARPVPTR